MIELHFPNCLAPIEISRQAYEAAREAFGIQPDEASYEIFFLLTIAALPYKFRKIMYLRFVESDEEAIQNI